MRAKMLSLMLLFSWVSSVLAVEMTPNARQSWLQNENVQHYTRTFMQYAEDKETGEIISGMEKLSLPEQEATRFLLLQKMEREKTVITPSLADYIETLSKIPPVYELRSVGDGYDFSTPAFAYPAVAKRLLKVWEKDQQIQQFLISAERKTLVLEEWLNRGTVNERKNRAKLIANELDGLSPPALNYLVEQVAVAQDKVIFWLPPEPVMVRLAQESGDARLYKMLWRMDANSEVQEELFRLMEQRDKQTIDIVMAASINPQLRSDSLRYLLTVSPMPPEIRGFFINELSSSDGKQVTATAKELIRYGHQEWVKSLVDTNKQVNKRAIRRALK